MQNIRNEVLTRLEGNRNKPMLLVHEGLKNRDSVEDAKLEGGKIRVLSLGTLYNLPARDVSVLIVDLTMMKVVLVLQ